MAVPNTYRPISGRFVTKANFGVLNIPDFLQAEGERDYFLSVVNIHRNTIIRALKSNGFSDGEIDDSLVQRVMDALPEYIRDRHAGARSRYTGLLRELLAFYASTQLSSGDIARLARELRPGSLQPYAAPPCGSAGASN